MNAITLDRSKFASAKSKLKSELEKNLLERAKQETEEKLRRTSIVVARELAERTFPSANAIGLAVAGMRFDISRVFITAGRAYEILKSTAGPGPAGAFYACYQKGNFQQAERILRESNSPLRAIAIGPLRPDLHEKARNSKTGRVMLKEPLQIVTKSDLGAYVKDRIKKIGKTASGWNACAMKLGGSEGETRWKSTAIHGADGGSIVIKNEGEKLVFEITNERPLARKHISPGQVAAIMKQGMEFLAGLMRE
jgi:hypothetical protein